MLKMKYDLIVVGGGILGAFHAYHAAKLKKRVLLIEKDYLPVGSTTQNFGQVVPSGLADPWFNYGRRTLEIYRDLQSKADLTLRRQGSIYIASDETEWQILQEMHDIHTQAHYPNVLLSAKGTLAKHPYLKKSYVKGALSYSEDMSVEPRVFIHRLINFLQEQENVVYQKNEAVVKCEESSVGVSLKTAMGNSYAADKVVICSGYVVNLLFADIFKTSGLIISKLQMLQTEPIQQLAMQGNILTGLTIRRYESFATCPSFSKQNTPEHYTELKKWGIHVLFKQAQDGSVIIGDSHEYAPATEAPALGTHTQEFIDALILQEAARIVDFPVHKIAARWAGFYAQHPDDIYEKDVTASIHIRTGIGGKGMSSSAGYAEASIRQLFL